MPDAAKASHKDDEAPVVLPPVKPITYWLDKTIPVTPGVRPSALFGLGAATRTAVARTRMAPAGPSAAKPVVAAEPDLPTVEIIRGDKRAREVVRQEQ